MIHGYSQVFYIKEFLSISQKSRINTTDVVFLGKVIYSKTATLL